MDQLRQVIHELVDISEESLNKMFLGDFEASFKKKEYLLRPGKVCEEVFFIKKGLVRVFLQRDDGTDYTCFFAMENMFISDYTSFLTNELSQYFIQAMEDTEVVVMPRDHINEEYQKSMEANIIGRKIAERYFIIFDTRIKDICLKSPKQRYEEITTLFPDIYNRVPQHMLASYLNISPVHLSRIRAQN